MADFVAIVAIPPIDSDKRKASAPINSTKKRILTELGDSKVWITQGKEIENYYTERVLQEWVKKDYKKDASINVTKFANIGELIEQQVGVKYNKTKNRCAREISHYLQAVDLDILDLSEKIKELATLIEKWNN